MCILLSFINLSFDAQLFTTMFIQEYMDASRTGEKWEPEPCCRAIALHDMRTPGLFKEEFTGDGIIALNPKTYYCWSDEKTKMSRKGLQRTNELSKEQYMSVLMTKVPVSGVNKGFIVKNHQMLTYRQLRCGLTYFYAKRKVLPDGVTTAPLDI